MGLAAAPTVSAEESAAPAVDFNRDVRPILSKSCFACHGRDENDRAAGLRLDVREVAIAKLESGALAPN